MQVSVNGVCGWWTCARMVCVEGLHSVWVSVDGVWVSVTGVWVSVTGVWDGVWWVSVNGGWMVWGG